MNKNDRKDFARASDLIVEARVKAQEALEILGPLADAEQEKFDNMSEGLQQAETGQRIEQAAEALSRVKEAVESAIESLEEAEGEDIE